MPSSKFTASPVFEDSDAEIIQKIVGRYGSKSAVVRDLASQRAELFKAGWSLEDDDLFKLFVKIAKSPARRHLIEALFDCDDKALKRIVSFVSDLRKTG